MGHHRESKSLKTPSYQVISPLTLDDSDVENPQPQNTSDQKWFFVKLTMTERSHNFHFWSLVLLFTNLHSSSSTNQYIYSIMSELTHVGKVALITGITGQDGSYLTEFLLSKGYTVRLYISLQRLAIHFGCSMARLHRVLRDRRDHEIFHNQVDEFFSLQNYLLWACMACSLGIAWHNMNLDMVAGFIHCEQHTNISQHTVWHAMNDIF